jgi:hypothetical protein
MSGYLFLKASDDGRPLSFLSPAQLRDLLDDPEAYAGITEFADPAIFDRDPNYWRDDIGALLKYEVVFPVPARGFRLPDEEEG